ncbi:MAG: glycosyltransferase [Flavihumibacter sp.]|nr:glycosyltransferase [Flavihumibacter sp.]
MNRSPILFIAYQFPPRGGPGVQRSTRFVEHLPSFGIDPIVLTVEYEEYIKAGETLDTTLLNRIPPETKIIRTRSFQLFSFVEWATRLRLFRICWYFGYPWLWERTARWPRKVFPIAKQIAVEEHCKVVYTSSGPFSALLLGRRLKKEVGLKWIADLRDPFTDAYAWLFPSRFHWMLARRIEKKVLSEADMIIVNTPEVKKWFLKRGISSDDKISVITNGY